MEVGGLSWAHLRSALERHLQANIGPYLAALVFVILGMALGLAAVGVLSPLQKADLLRYLGGFMTGLRDGGVSGPAVMREALGTNLRSVLVAFVLGLTVIGLPGLAMLLVLRGFVVGFTAAFLAQELGARGYLLIAAGVIPPTLLLLPALMALGVGAFRFAARLVQTRLHDRAQILEAGGRFMATGALAAALVVGAAVLEAYVSPLLLSALWPFVGG